MNTRFASIAICCLLSAISEMAYAQGTAFTYQGRLNDGANPANGVYDLRFEIFDASVNGNQISGSYTYQGLGVTNGLFTVTLDFGSFFNGQDRWLDIAVRTNGDPTFTPLMPRQQLTPTPYAIFANSVSNLLGTLATTQLNGTIPGSQVNGATGAATNFTGNLSGDVTGTQTATVVSFVGGQTAANVASGASAANGATNADFPNTIVRRDATGAFVAESLALDNQEIRSSGSGAYNLRDYLLRADSSKGNLYVGDNFPRATFATGSGNTGVGSGAAFFDTFGSYNTGVGYGALGNSTNVNDNTAVGAYALQSAQNSNANTANGYQALYSDTIGGDNTAVGYQALYANVDGGFDTADGYQALYSNTSGGWNTAIGFGTLYSNTVGGFNTAIGLNALYSNTAGRVNTANGAYALFSNTTASNNVANGYQALYANTIGGDNTANGFQALRSNNAFGNTGCGFQTLYANTTGNYNTAIGWQCLSADTGYDNTACGAQALQGTTTGSYNTAVGDGALISCNGNLNIALGVNAGFNLTTGSSNIDIGHPAYSTDTNIIRIGYGQTATFIAGIYNATAPAGIPVVINLEGRLGTTTSSERFKQNIRGMGDTSDVLLALQPVTFQYKPDIDPQGLAQFGLIAEQVEKADPDLVVHDAEHGIYTVRYEAVNAMLLNEFLKEHRKVEEQNGEIQTLQAKAAKVDLLEKRLEKLETMIKSQIERN